MRTAEEIINDYKKNPQRPTYLGLIKQVQDEAWNEAIMTAIKAVRYNQKTNKDLMIKLLK